MIKTQKCGGKVKFSFLKTEPETVITSQPITLVSSLLYSFFTIEKFLGPYLVTMPFAAIFEDIKFQRYRWAKNRLKIVMKLGLEPLKPMKMVIRRGCVFFCSGRKCFDSLYYRLSNVPSSYPYTTFHRASLDSIESYLDKFLHGQPLKKLHSGVWWRNKNDFTLVKKRMSIELNGCITWIEWFSLSVFTVYKLPYIFSLTDTHSRELILGRMCKTRIRSDCDGRASFLLFQFVCRHPSTWPQIMHSGINLVALFTILL